MQLMGKIWPRRVPCCMLSAPFGAPLLTQFTISFLHRRVPFSMLSGALFDAVYPQFLAEKPATTRSTVSGRKPSETTGNHRKRTETTGNGRIFEKNRPLGEGKGEGDWPFSHSLLPPAKAGVGGCIYIYIYRFKYINYYYIYSLVLYGSSVTFVLSLERL